MKGIYFINISSPFTKLEVNEPFLKMYLKYYYFIQQRDFNSVIFSTLRHLRVQTHLRDRN